jgi:hypothetical protein
LTGPRVAAWIDATTVPDTPTWPLLPEDVILVA